MLSSSPARGLRAIVAAISGAVPTVRHRLSTPRSASRLAVYEPLEPRQMLSVNVPTYHYSNAETGANTDETILTPSNVNTSTFGKVASMAVDGQIYGQPLIMTGIPMANGEGTHDIVIVTTENDSVYAFDAYGNNPAQGYLWKTSLLEGSETAVPQSDYGTNDITPQLGITGTPVINPATGTLYVVGLFAEGNGTFEQRLYALNISSGANAIAPVTIAATISGTGYDSVGGVVTFNAYRENQRPALTLANGEVYIGWSSHGDEDPWHGWLIAYNAATLHQDYVYCDTANGGEGGIWMSGGGIAVDSAGDLYFTTGNGSFDANTNGGDYSMSLEELSPSLSVEDYFSPDDEASLSGNDLDYGCSNVILINNQAGAAPNEVLSAGKWGSIFLNNSNTGSLGEFNSSTNNDLGEASIGGDVHNTLVYWNGSVYLGGDGVPVDAFSVTDSTLGTTPSSQTSRNFGTQGADDGQGAGLTVSSNGTNDGILWALDNTGFNNNPATLYAYNANNLGDLLWSSNEAANGRDTCGDAVKFQDPVVANGFVYVAGAGSLTVYGLIQASTSAPTLVTPAAANPSTVTGNTTNLSVSATDVTSDLHPVYTWAASTLPNGATAPTFSANGTNASNDPTVTFYAAGAYTFTATIQDPNSGLTITSSVNVTVEQTFTSVSVTPSAATVYDGDTVQFSASADDQFGEPMSSGLTFTWSVNPGGVGGAVNSSGLYTAPANGTGSDTVKATAGSYVATASVSVVAPGSTIQVNLSGDDNRVGIVADGTTFGGGLDTGGSALSSNLLGTSQTWNGSTFTIPAATPGNNVNNVVYGAGQTITLSASTYSSIELLADHTDGDAPNEQLTVNYTDGTTQTLTQSFSDWYTPQGYPGESIAVTMPYRDENSGAMDNRTFYVYGYSFALNSSKTVQSITLPNDGNLEIIAMDLVGAESNNNTATASFYPTLAGWYRAGVWQGTSGTDNGGDYTSPAGNTVLIAKNPNGGTLRDPYLKFNISDAAFAGDTIDSVTLTFSAAALNQAGPLEFGVYGMTNTSWGATTADPSPAPNYPGSALIGAAQNVGAAQGAYASYTFNLGTYITDATNGVLSFELNSPGATGQETGIEVDNALDTLGVDPVITVTYTIAQPAWLGAGSQATWNSTTKVLTVTGPTSIVADPGSDEPIIEANGSSAVVTIDPTSALQVHIGGLSLTNGASAIVTSLGAARTAANHRVLVLGEPGATSAPLLDIDSTSYLDLTDNDLVDHDGNLAAINSLLASGFNSASGYWNGKGIISSKAAAATLYALGDAQPTAAGTFDGESVTTSDVEVRYTYYGDANLDGHVDASDYSLIDNGYLNHLTGWSNGDFNYDGVINGSDYTLIDNAFNVQGASLDAELAAPSAQIAGPTKGIGSIKTEPVFSNSDLQTAGPGISFAPSQTPLVDLLGVTTAPASYPDESDVVTLASLNAQNALADILLLYVDAGPSSPQGLATVKSLGMPSYSDVTIMPAGLV